MVVLFLGPSNLATQQAVNVEGVLVVLVFCLLLKLAIDGVLVALAFQVGL